MRNVFHWRFGNWKKASSSSPPSCRLSDQAGQREAGRRRRKDAHVGPHAAVGDRLRLARRAAGFTVQALAWKAGVGRMTIVRAERGHHLPRAGILQRIAGATGTTVDWLLTGTDATP